MGDSPVSLVNGMIADSDSSDPMVHTRACHLHEIVVYAQYPLFLAHAVCHYEVFVTSTHPLQIRCLFVFYPSSAKDLFLFCSSFCLTVFSCSVDGGEEVFCHFSGITGTMILTDPMFKYMPTVGFLALWSHIQTYLMLCLYFCTRQSFTSSVPAP